MKSITAIGIMSGTSVDGLDIVAVTFTEKKDKWDFEIIKALSVDYPSDLKKKLIESIQFGGEDLVKLDIHFGQYIATAINSFLEGEKIKPDIISSHGHTVFHQPESGITHQIGDGQTIMNMTGITVVNDFRKLDVLRGGQGAPLVPIGDKFLFAEYDFCLNIGGFSNVSFDNVSNDRLAYDISPANIVLNFLSRKARKDFDRNGRMASSGKIIPELLQDLNMLEYYSMPAPKSLGLEWVKHNIFPLLEKQLQKENLEDVLRTCTEHISIQIVKAIELEIKKYRKNTQSSVLVTGGGAYNDLLIERLKRNSSGSEFIIPGKDIVNFKEAIIFGLLGVLRRSGKINVLKSVTGAVSDSSSGTIHQL